MSIPLNVYSEPSKLRIGFPSGAVYFPLMSISNSAPTSEWLCKSSEICVDDKGLSSKLPIGQSEQIGKYFRITDGDNSFGHEVKDEEFAIKSIVGRSG